MQDGGLDLVDDEDPKLVDPFEDPDLAQFEEPNRGVLEKLYHRYIIIIFIFIKSRVLVESGGENEFHERD